MGKRILALWLCLMMLLPVLPVGIRAEEGINSGDRVVVWNEACSMALSAEPCDFYRAGRAVTWENGTLTGYSPSEIWTLSVNEDGSWRFENGGRYLSVDAVSQQIGLDGPHDGWILQETGDGSFRVVNRDFEKYLTWHEVRGVYLMTGSEVANNALRFYVLPPEIPETTGTTSQPVTETPVETSQPVTEPPSEPAQPPTEPPEETLDTGEWNLYVGQLHAHTADSDGTGTVEEAFEQASQVEGLDFFAVTDHSDSLDNDTLATLTEDGSAISRKWAAGREAARSVTREDFVGIYGFEMSWNQGQGHISTFNTPGFLSRDREGYSDYKDGMETYYQALLEVPNAVSQFNHPGTNQGDFKDFQYISKEVDARIHLIEVGSGSGGEYQTAYDAYTQALDRGWHLAPTNNQNDHTGHFGNGDTNRTVILAKSLSEADIYDALRHYRAYATEDADLQIFYTLNGTVMGSELSADQLGDTVRLSVQLLDPTDAQWGVLEVVTSGGAVAASAPADAQVTLALPSSAPYYYIRITQPDGDVAVTAPVWIRQADDLGVAEFSGEDPVIRAGEPRALRLKLYNNEGEDMTVTRIRITDPYGDALWDDGETLVLGQFEERELVIPVCFPQAGMYTLTAEISVEFEGENRNISEKLELSVLPEAVTSDVLIDGTHGAVGKYDALEALAGAQQIAVYVETGEITAEQLENCSLLIILAPEEAFSDGFLENIKHYVNHGGGLILLGTAGGSEEISRLLQSLGASMNLRTDAVAAQGVTARFNQSACTQGILEGQTYAHSGGCALDVGKGQWLVRNEEGEILLAVEGNVILAGSDFLRDEYLAEGDQVWDLPYANRTIMENVLGITRTLPEITPVGQVREGEPGEMYLVEGLVTVGTANPNTLFPDTIYVQDATGGIAAVNCGTQRLELGRRVRILGCLEILEGEPQLRIDSLYVLNKETPIEPRTAGNQLDHSTQGGQLLRLRGKVVDATYEGDAVGQFVLEDSTGARATVWVANSVLSGSLGRNSLAGIVKTGNEISAVGIPYRLDGKTVLRLRDCDEVVLIAEAPEPTTKSTEATETTEATTEPAAPTEPAAETTEAAAAAVETMQESTAAPVEKETVRETQAPPTRILPGGTAQPGNTFLWKALLFFGLSLAAWLLKNRFRK